MKEKKSLACGGIVAHYGSLFQLQCYELSLSLSLSIVDFNVMVSLYTIIQFQLHYLSLFMFSLFFKKQLLFVLWIFYDCKKKESKKSQQSCAMTSNGGVVLVLMQSLARFVRLMTVRHYGKKTFLSCFCVLKLDWFDSLSLSSMVGSYSVYASMTVTSEFFSRSRVHDFFFSSFFFNKHLFNIVI